jgi:hypothetical protein
MHRTSSPFKKISAAYLGLKTDDRYGIDGTEFAGMPDKALNMGEVGEILLDPMTSPSVRDGVWRILVTNFRGTEDEAWAVICFGIARPGLVRAVNRARRICPEMQLEDLESEALNIFVEMIGKMNIAKPRLCSRICQEISSRVRTLARDHLRDIKTAVRVGFESRIPPRPFGHVDLVLANAVVEGIITPFEAEMIASTRIEHRDMTRLAEQSGTSRVDIHLLRKKAEYRLTEWLQR